MPLAKKQRHTATKAKPGPRPRRLQRKGNPKDELMKLLEQSGAELLRQNNHLVYRLPNGNNFVMGKTPSDRRTAKNDLSDLRRALGSTAIIEAAAPIPAPERPSQPPAPDPSPIEPKEIEPPMSTQLAELGSKTTTIESVVPARFEGLAIAVMKPAPEPFVSDELMSVASLPDTCASFKQRLEATIIAEEARLGRIMAEADIVEQRLKLLRAIQPHINTEDRLVPEILRVLLPPPAVQPLPIRAIPPTPPDAITDRVMVTRPLVYAAIQTLDGEFTINDVLRVMINGRAVSDPERLRIRTSIAASMVTLGERGELCRQTQGQGRAPSTWSKIPAPVPQTSNADETT